MKAVLVWATLLFLLFVVVMAVVFRSEAARDILRFARRMLWAYVALVVVLAAIHLWREGF
ncbi:MAG: hypothetical protein HUU14_03250 [Dehalococcoidia bacterium]|nr:hypothetical protein [Chloroflexi bacterium CFX7]MCK6563801.1 hypothetical protein [Dehalococcoidia bacterium]MCL4231433.1 hypothetical protein [Dehalococcoidia bacterium]NUQ54884.1 hypothetical protein [Dehalococcoidia bacterium]RIL03747.1 MAG: hypothetical protein DCC78_03055 [bacterium]